LGVSQVQEPYGRRGSASRGDAAFKSGAKRALLRRLTDNLGEQKLRRLLALCVDASVLRNVLAHPDLEHRERQLARLRAQLGSERFAYLCQEAEEAEEIREDDLGTPEMPDSDTSKTPGKLLTKISAGHPNRRRRPSSPALS